MSYIHDALKRSQAQRQQTKASAKDTHDVSVDNAHVEKRRVVPWVPFSLLVFGVGLSLLAYRIGTTTPESAPSAESFVKSTLEPEAGPVTPGIHSQDQSAIPLSLSTPYDKLPFYWELPQSLRGRLGKLAVTIHVYANDPGQRFLFLNNREYRAGEQMPSGVKVERIEPQGVVLSYTDQVFRLPRPR